MLQFLTVVVVSNRKLYLVGTLENQMQLDLNIQYTLHSACVSHCHDITVFFLTIVNYKYCIIKDLCNVTIYKLDVKFTIFLKFQVLMTIGHLQIIILEMNRIKCIQKCYCKYFLLLNFFLTSTQQINR